MAEIIDRNVESQPVSRSYYIWRIALLGAVLGVLYWFFTEIVLRLISSVGVAGGVASILVATIGIIIMLNLFTARPLLISLACAVSLWGLAQLTAGLLWFEIIAWNVIIYGLAYLLFSWVARYKRVMPALIAVIVIVVIVRIISVL